MSTVQRRRDAAEPHELTVTDRLTERPALHPGKAVQTKPRDLWIRFVAGALTSIVSGATTLAFGPRVGGILLAFPAILAASLTLIEQQDDSEEAREDGRGAIAGGCALMVFAIVAVLAFGHLSGAIALLLATAAWTVTALALYVALWGR